MSDNDDEIDEFEEFQNQLYKKASSININQISLKYDRKMEEGLKEEDLSGLRENLRNLTTSMKDSLKNEHSNGRPILGRVSDSSDKSCAEFSPRSDDKQLNKAEKSHVNHILRSSLVETNASDVEIRQSDPTDPLYSVTSFQDLHLSSELVRGILSLNFRKPSGIQEKSLPMLLTDPPKNLIAQSQSGTGKTATFLLTMLSRVDITKKYCQCLCIAPTRELALQIADVAVNMSKYMNGLKISCGIRGVIPNLNGTEVESHIVIGTPGTIKFWTNDDSCIYINPRKIKVFVLDEADVLIENAEFLNISKRIKSKLTQDCQILLFSATYDDKVMEFAREFVPSFNEIRVKPKELTLKNIKQFYISLDVYENKYITLIEIFGMKPIGQCIIFCESRRMAGFLQKQLESDGHLSSLLSGELDVQCREEEISNFRNGKSRVLIATNVCSRGIDIPQVTLIINWDMPRNQDGSPDCETYLHRIGRSGRFGKTGLTINFIVSPMDKQIQDTIVERYGTQIEELNNLEIVASVK